MNALLDLLLSTPVRAALVFFLCVHPLGSGLLSACGALVRFRTRLSPLDLTEAEVIDLARQRFPLISVLIAAHNEERVIVKAIQRVLLLDWPEIDLVVVDDGSTDGTREKVRPFVATGQVRLLHKPRNEGKAMAQNDGLWLCRGELVLLLDADGQPAPDAVARMAVHLLQPGIAAVTGNPRVGNTRTMLARMQAIEFCATVGIERRSNMLWGCLMTMSGLCILARRDVLLGMGGFTPAMATEDIELTWRLQLAGYAVDYEPTALFGMQVPDTLSAWWRQRCRWALGLAQVIRRHGRRAIQPRSGMWPVLLNGSLSILWAHLLLLTVVLFMIAWATGRETGYIAPAFTLIASITIISCVVQIAAGMRMDYQRDRGVARQVLWVAWYPLVYWAMCVLTVLRKSLPGLLRKPRGAVRWATVRHE